MERTHLCSSTLLTTLCTLIVVLAFTMAGLVSPHLARAASTTHHSAKAGHPHFMKTRRAAKTTNPTVDDVTYHNGQVMQQTSITYAIFWEPPTLPDGTATQVSANYHSLIERYLGDIGGSGLYNNNTQYYDNFTGHINNSSTFGGAWVDSSPYPPSDCSDAATPHGCLTDADIVREINTAQGTNPGWGNGYTHLFLVFTSWGEGSCTDTSSTTCAFAQNGYCAYHNAVLSSPPLLYANIPYAGTDLADCGVSTSPNNDMDSDSAINLVSHEQMAAVTDPLIGSGWFDSLSFDIADKCDFVFGPMTLDGGLADAQWNGHFYVVQEQWSNVSAQCVLATTGALLKATVYVGANDGTIYALNASDGSVRWSYATGAGINSAPLVANGVVYIGNTGGYVYAFNASSGLPLWHIQIGGGIGSSPTVANKLLYLGSIAGSLYALNIADGSIRWRYATGLGISSTPRVVGGVVYFGSADGNVYALNALHGALLWKYTTGGGVSSSPAVVNGVVYIGSNDQKVYALNASNGSLLWSYQTGGPINFSLPAVVNGVMYIGSYDSKVYALNASDGSLKWTSLLGGAIGTSPQVVGSLVYVGSSDDNVYALNISDGSQRWHYTTGGAVYSTPQVVGGVVFVGSYDHNLYALSASTGTLKWNYTTNAIVSSPTISTVGY